MASETAVIDQNYGLHYLGNDAVRLHSYRQQVAYALRSKPQSVLVIGTGDGLVRDLLDSAGLRVATLDIDETLDPDIIASVLDMPVADASFDVCVCCQVLEHLPFGQFGRALSEIERVTRCNLVLSLPDVTRYLGLNFRAGRFNVSMQGMLPRFRQVAIPPERLRDHGHHWEIGYSGFGSSVVRKRIEGAGWRIAEEVRVHEFPWHHFFYLAKAPDAE